MDSKPQSKGSHQKLKQFSNDQSFSNAEILFTSSPDAIFVQSLDGHVLEVNPAACELHKMTREQLIGKHVLDLVPPEHQVNVKTGYEDLCRGNENHAMGLSLASDGSTIPVEIRATPIQYDGADALLMHVRDISRRIETENELQLMRFSIEHTADSIYWIDENARFVYVNNSAVQALGYSRSELLSMTVQDIDPNIRQSDWPTRWSELQEKGSRTIESIHMRKDGESIPVEISSNYVEFEGQKYSFSFVKDIRKRKKLESEYFHVARLNTMGEMTAGIAHELNQPLFSISNYFQACMHLLDQSPIPTQDLATYLKRASTEALRAGQIINHLREYTQNQSSARTRLNVNDLIGEVERMIQFDAVHEGVSISLNLSEGLPDVLGDQIELQQVLLNAVRNSFDAMADNSDKRELTIQSENRDELVAISIIDSGCGLPKGESQQIFEAFVSTKEKGMGIGLAISRRIIHAHGGEIIARNNANRGATISIELPIAQEVGMDGERH